MNKGGVGVGSASIILVFSVLCLTVFSLITFVVAGNDKVLVESESRFVIGYYGADELAERVLDELLKTEIGIKPESLLGVDIESDYDMALGATVFYYSCPVSDDKELFVRLARSYDSYDILTWRMQDTGDWVMDEYLNVFTGFDDWDSPMWDMTAPMWDTGSQLWDDIEIDDDSGGSDLFPFEIEDGE